MSEPKAGRKLQPGHQKGECKMTKFVTRFSRDESGASAAEYALILAIVGSAIAVAALALGNSVSSAMNRAASRINATNT